MQAKAERLANGLLRHAAFQQNFGHYSCHDPQCKVCKAGAIIVSECLNLPALLTAEAELSHIDAVLARRPALADEPDRCAKIEKAINVAKQVDSLRTELESTNMALKASCQCAEQFKKERDKLKAESQMKSSALQSCERDRQKLIRGRPLEELSNFAAGSHWKTEVDQLRAELTKAHETTESIIAPAEVGGGIVAYLRAELAKTKEISEKYEDRYFASNADLATAKAENADLRKCAVALQGFLGDGDIEKEIAAARAALSTLAEKGVVL